MAALTQVENLGDVGGDEENAVVYKEIKEAQETLDTTPADRVAIIEEAKARMAVWSEFAPQRMGEAEVRAIVLETLAELGGSLTAQEKGKLMKVLMPKLKGKAEGNLVNQVVTDVLQ